MVKEFWDQRYSGEEYAYGTKPNLFFKTFIDSYPPGKILLPGEGEGRNAVYAALKGWEATAIDHSEEGMIKAKKLASLNQVSIAYLVQDLTTINKNPEKYDAIALVFVHLPPDTRTTIHQKLISMLKPGGWLLMEAFNKKQLGRNTGGPPDADMLYDEQVLQRDFKSLEILELYEKLESFDEGPYHQGIGSIIRMIAKKTP
jgi:2-polyprenyl-3-methyl-5-hydroxy-6-metoxy-1,4-benzoquinol methylase